MARKLSTHVSTQHNAIRHTNHRYNVYYITPPQDPFYAQSQERGRLLTNFCLHVSLEAWSNSSIHQITAKRTMNAERAGASAGVPSSSKAEWRVKRGLSGSRPS